jgi:hypothetical protein
VYDPTAAVEAEAWYGPASFWGRRDMFVFDMGTGVARSPDAVDQTFIDVRNRYKNLGLRGSSYMICNPTIQTGDVLRVMDIRDKDDAGTSFGATIDLGVSAAEYVKNAVASKFTHLDTDKLGPATVNFGLQGIENIYWIWKVRHYVGQHEVTTKAFFVKEPQTLIGTTDSYRQHQIQRKKAPRISVLEGDE